MARKVTTIPAVRTIRRDVPSFTKKRVAGYARVSTDTLEQATSYQAQMSYYRSYILSHDDWEFAGMYSDEGISATNTAHRDGFNQMIEDALNGRIDLIITKSVSRFARNTVDSLTNVRKLKAHGVEVYFEKENIWTMDSKGELLITIMSSLAQEESRSISENVAWGKRKGFAEGKCSLAYGAFLGYDKDFKINEEQAELVRLIYKLFISGFSEYRIAKFLEKKGERAPGGGLKWYSSTVCSILQNEKYKGDALLQKAFTQDFLSKKRKKNEGELPQYYVENHHEGIIDSAQFDFVQTEIVRRKQNGRYSGNDIFSSKIQCGCCGAWFGRKVWHSNEKYRKVIYQCNRKYRKGERPCPVPYVTEEEIKNAFVKAMNSLTDIKEECLSNVAGIIDAECDTKELYAELERLEQEMENISGGLDELIRKNAAGMNQEEYLREEERFIILQEDACKAYRKAEEDIKYKEDRCKVLFNFLERVRELGDEQIEFRPELWGSLVELVRVDENKNFKVIFRGGIEV